jgi:Uma2 family endonuclease
MRLTQKKFHTEEEYENFENEGLLEYNSGEIIAMAPPSRIQQQISFEVSRLIGNFLQGKPCRVYQAPFEVRLELQDGIKRLQPDISVVCDSYKLTDKGCTGAPDFIVEIASPGNILYDYVTKASWYRQAGVKEYWIINPMNRKITMLRYEHDSLQEYTFENNIPIHTLPGLSIDFSQIDLS